MKIGCFTVYFKEFIMNNQENPDTTPEPAPAPQLPNIPASPDDPFQPEPARNPPITVPPYPKPDTPVEKSPQDVD
jgi:hypothetical protein